MEVVVEKGEHSTEDADAKDPARGEDTSAQESKVREEDGKDTSDKEEKVWEAEQVAELVRESSQESLTSHQRDWLRADPLRSERHGGILPDSPQGSDAQNQTGASLGSALS